MVMMGSGGASSSSGRQALYQGLHPNYHLHESTNERRGSGSGVGGDDTTMGNCGGMGVCGDVDPLSSPRMDPIGVGVDDTASEDDEEDIEEDEEDEDEDDSSEISASDEDGSWIEWFCGLRGNEFFCEVDEDFIQDDFNLTGLYGLVPCYERALDMVLDVEMPNEDIFTEEQHEIVESAAEMLYGMIHARYIVTSRGMNAMYEKYRSATFGRCPHVYCQGQPVLPVGLSDMPRNYTVNVFCPRCHGLFFPKSTRQANIDGAYFGTTFPHLYLMTHPEMIPVRPSQQYVPRVYGFRINQSSLYYRFHEGEEEENPGQNENRALARSSRSRQR
jgi:casein kinase II subunit beta